MSSKDDALRKKKKQEKLSNELLGISNVEFEPKEKKKPQQEQFKKKCGRCNKTKLLHNFGEDKRFSDNLKSICNLCEIALEKEANSKIKNLDLKSSQSTKPKTTPTQNAVQKPESNQTEKIDNSTNANSSSDSSEGSFLAGLFAIGLVVGAIYLVVKIFGFGIDFVSSFFEESSEPTMVVNNDPTSDTQITQTDFCLNWENEIETLQKAFLSGESDLTIELNIYKTCFNNQIYFYIGKALDEKNINYYNSERFEICCEVLAFNLIDKLVYGSLGFFDPPNLNIKKPLNLEFYGGSLNLEELDKLNFTNMNYETREIIILKGVSSTTTTSPPTNYTQVPEDKKAPYFIFKECKTLYSAPTDESWDVSFLITAENSAVNILYYEIILDGILVGSNTIDLNIENYNSREISFTLNNITGLKAASSIFIKAEVYTIDGLKVSRGCRSLFSENNSSDSNSSSMTTTTTVSDTTTTTILETTGTTILDNVKPEFNKQLTSNNITSTKADLSWQATDNIGILKYVLREGSFIVYEGLKNTKVLEGLKPNKSYTFTVDAYDKSGNISSSSVSFDTLEQSSTSTSTTIPTTTSTTTTTTIPTTTSTTTTTTIPIPATIYGVHGGAGSDSIEGIAVNGNSFYLGGYFGDSIAFHQNSISTSSGTDAFLAKYVQNSGYTWVKTFSNTGSSAILDVSSKNNYVYITGHFSGTITFGSTTLTSNGSNDIFIAKLSLDGDTQWAKSYGGPHNDSSLSIAIDANENIYLGGYFNGNNNETITIGNDTYTTSAPTTSSYSDGLIIKLNSSGVFQWSRAFQSSYNTNVNDIVVDQNNNVYITGAYRGTTDFGGTTLSYVSGNGFFYLAKYDQSGNYQFAKGYGSNGNEQGFGIDINSSGEILVVGSFGNSDVSNYSVDFGNGNLISNGSSDILILKFDSNGNTLNSINFGGSSSEGARDIIVDSSNNIYISGAIYGSFSFGNSITPEGGSDGFIAKLNSNLNPVWIKRAGGSSNDIILELKMFNNNIVGVGYVQGSSMNFNGTILSTFGSRDGAVFALDSSGNLK